MTNSHLNNSSTCATMTKASPPPSYQAPKAQFTPVIVDGKLAFKFDAQRGLIEWQHRGEKHIIDLSNYQ